MDLEGKTELSGHDVAQSLVDKVGGIENFVNGNWSGETAADTSQEPAADAPLETGTTEEPAIVEDARGNLHSREDGKFVEKSKEQGDESATETDDEEETTDESEQAEETADDADEEGVTYLDIDDPDVASFLEKYNGDLEKALKGAVELQKMSGRQTGELGELRKLETELQEMRALLERGVQPSVHVPYELERLAEAAEDAEEPRALSPKFHDLAERVSKTGDLEAVGEVVAEWQEHDPFSAAMYMTSLVNQFQQDALLEQLSKTDAPSAPAGAQGDVDAEVAKVVERHPDLEKFIPQIGEMAKERPYLAAALQNGSAAEKASALEDLYLLARSRDTDTSREAIKRVQIRTQTETERAKADAAVVSGGRSSAASADQPTAADDFRQRFRKAAGLPDDIEVV